MNAIQEVKPVFKIQSSMVNTMDQPVLGETTHRVLKVTMDVATACSLGFALIGAWLLGYRHASFLCEFNFFSETSRIKLWEHLNSWLFVGVVGKQCSLGVFELKVHIIFMNIHIYIYLYTCIKECID